MATLHNDAINELDIKGFKFGNGLEFGDSYKLHLHLQAPTLKSIFRGGSGLKIRAAITQNEKTIDVLTLRLGGMLRVGESLYGCTTAKGILKMMLKHNPPQPHGLQSTDHAVPDKLRDQLGHRSGEMTENYMHGDANKTNQSLAENQPPAGDLNGPWTPIPRAVVPGFMNDVVTLDGTLQMPREKPLLHDVALLDLGGAKLLDVIGEVTVKGYDGIPWGRKIKRCDYVHGHFYDSAFDRKTFNGSVLNGVPQEGPPEQCEVRSHDGERLFFGRMLYGEGTETFLDGAEFTFRTLEFQKPFGTLRIS